MGIMFSVHASHAFIAMARYICPLFRVYTSDSVYSSRGIMSFSSISHSVTLLHWTRFSVMLYYSVSRCYVLSHYSQFKYFQYISVFPSCSNYIICSVIFCSAIAVFLSCMLSPFKVLTHTISYKFSWCSFKHQNWDHT